MKNKSSLLLLLLGTLVACMSLYQVSVVGFFEKMGLVGQEGADMFDHNELVREVAGDAWWECPKEVEIIGSLGYLLANDTDKLEMGWSLGERRIKCGVEQIVRGDVLSGVYKVIRGTKYWENSLELMKQSGEVCRQVISPLYILHLERLVELSKGGLRVVLGNTEEKIHTQIRYEAERCIDQQGDAE